MKNPSTDHPRDDILVVEDSLPSLQAVQNVLTEGGYKVRGATDGRTAMMIAQSKPPGLILLDVSLPGMDGFEVCQHLKSESETHDIPVIFITAKDDVVDKMKGFEVGGVDYITKPFQAEDVLARVETHLTIRNLQKRLEAKNLELQEKNHQLEEALLNIKTLRGLLPICAHCKNIRDDRGYWQQVEVYIRAHSEAEFSHGICPGCVEKFYPTGRRRVAGPDSGRRSDGAALVGEEWNGE